MSDRAASDLNASPTSGLPRRGRRTPSQHPGPPLGVPAGVALAAFVAAVATGPLLGQGPLPSPWSPSAEIERYFVDSRTATAVGSWLLVLSATALLFFSALVFSRLNFLAPHAPGPVIAGLGGVAASLSLAVSAAPMWALSQPNIALNAAWPQMRPLGSDHLVHSLDYLMFVTGGPIHVVGLGVMVLGIAVTMHFIRRTPAWLARVGVGLAALCIASSIAMMTQIGAPMLPIGRFLALFWLVGVALIIPRERGPRRRR